MIGNGRIGFFRSGYLRPDLYDRVVFLRKSFGWCSLLEEACVAHVVHVLLVEI